jgi:outer membrane protein assembly factor BamB
VLHASPVVAQGRVYVPVTNPNAGSPGSGLLCLDARTGHELWRAKSPRGDLRGPLTVLGDRVYAMSSEGWVAAYQAQSGQTLWSIPLDESYRRGRPLAINQTPPVPAAQGLLASDWQTPQLLLDYATGRQVARLAGNVGYCAAFATVFDQTMYCASRGGSLALRFPSGQVLWRGQETARSTSAGIVVDGRLLYTAGSSVKAIDAATGRLIWQGSVGNVGQQQPVPVVWDDLVLVSGTDFSAIDLATGKPRWSVACGREPDRFARSQRQVLSGSSSPLVAGRLAYFGHDDTSLRAVDRSGRLVWEYRLGTPIKTAPAVSGNLLLVHDYAGNLWCFAPVEP